MTERQLTELTSLVESLEVAGKVPDTEQLAQVALAVAKMFEVDPDEVAILALNLQAKNLKFVIPEKLATVGTIPLNSGNSLAARTARQKKAELVNNFNVSRHASVFEGVPLGRRHGEPIHKIMSAPILRGPSVAGVIQISRKGESASDAGPDFVQKDLQVLISLTPALDRFLKLCQSV